MLFPVCSLDSCLRFSAAPAFSQVKRSHVKLHVCSYITSECDPKILHNQKLCRVYMCYGAGAGAGPGNELNTADYLNRIRNLRVKASVAVHKFAL